MLKRIFVFVLVLFVFTGCENADYTNNNSVDVSSVSSTSSQSETYEYYEVDKEFTVDVPLEKQVDFELHDIHLDLEPINSKDNAYTAGEIILKQFQKSGYLKEHKIQAIAHYTNENLWFYSYMPKDISTDYTCDKMSILIEGDTGNVKMCWAETVILEENLPDGVDVDID
ncbi:MAG: hypothetical protein IJ462_03710 [Clostridia bacterium]|nr:hypothetical protein [Clostridia bacterium]